MTDDPRLDLGPRNRAMFTELAGHIRGEMDVARALKVVARYPIYAVLGGHFHSRLNEDLFAKEARAAE